MDNYYEELSRQVKEYIEEESYEQAKQLLEAEFAMPYIPSAVEQTLQELYQICCSELKAMHKQKKYDEEDIEKLLFANVEQGVQAVELIRNANIRKYLSIIETYLKDTPHFLIRSLLIECLIEQQVSDEIAINFDGLEVSFIPTYCELPQDQDAFIEAVKQVQTYYENENPTFLAMCIQCMMKEMYFKMPFSLGKDEVKCFIYAILEYVYKANQDEEGFNAFILEKNLAKYGGYTLLLYEYNI